MNRRWVISLAASAALIAVIVVLARLLTGSVGLTATPAPASPPTQSPGQPTPPLPILPSVLPPVPGSPTTALNPILLENQKPGSLGWQPGSGFDSKNTHSVIAGFADATSVDVGGTIRFAVSTRTPGDTFSIHIYRLGWYGGVGGRLLLTATDLKGAAQGYWDSTTHAVVGCPSCEIDAQTGLIDTHWKPSFALTVPADWISGDYLAKLTDRAGGEAFINFVVRDDRRRSDLLVQFATNTVQAYNDWGGTSLYAFSPDEPATVYGGRIGVKVSFNRPIAGMSASHIYADIQMVHFLERFGYDATYTTSTDIEANPGALGNHKAFISVGHDEYWTRAMRDTVEQARDAGMNLAFFGGNDVYWQARLEADSQGTPRRVLVVYRDARLDPKALTDPGDTTVLFIEPPVNRPQNSLTGTIFGGITEHPLGFPWVVASTAPEALLAGTGLRPGDSVPALVGKECDSVADNGSQPRDLVIVAASPFTTKQGILITCHTTFYRTTAGSSVFNAGTLSWPAALDGFGHHNPGLAADDRIIGLTRNVLAVFGARAAEP